MNDIKVQVPEGMLKAAKSAVERHIKNPTDLEGAAYVAVEAALRWLSENPIEPSVSEAVALCEPLGCRAVGSPLAKYAATEWQRRMFLAPKSDALSKELPNEFYEMKTGEGIFSSSGLMIGIWDGNNIISPKNGRVNDSE